MEFCEREKEPVPVPVRRHEQKAEMPREPLELGEGKESYTEHSAMNKSRIIPRRWCVY